MSFSGKIRVQGTKEELDVYFNAIKPEEEERKRANFKAEISKGILKKTELIITIDAEDFVAFRSTTTSILNMIAIVEKSLQATA